MAGRTYVFKASGIHPAAKLRVGTARDATPEWVTGDVDGITGHSGTIRVAPPKDYVGPLVLYCANHPYNNEEAWVGPRLESVLTRLADRAIENETARARGGTGASVGVDGDWTRGSSQQSICIETADWRKWQLQDADGLFVSNSATPTPRVVDVQLVPAGKQEALPDGVEPCSFLRAALSRQAALGGGDDPSRDVGRPRPGYSISLTPSSMAAGDAPQRDRRRRALHRARTHQPISDAKPQLGYYWLNPKYLSRKFKGRLYELVVVTDHPGVTARTAPFRLVSKHPR